jgi:hypothetical protein
VSLMGLVQREQRRRRRERTERFTFALGTCAMAAAGFVIVGELLRVREKAKSVEEFAEPAALAPVEVVRAGYRGGSVRENALLSLLTSFTLTFGLARLSTHAIRADRSFGPFGNLKIGKSHVHHFVPGIGLALLAGGVSILTKDERLDPLLAIPFGIGTALTLDESALLIKLDDVYWSEEGIMSVQITMSALLGVSAFALVLRLLRRGEDEVFSGPVPATEPEPAQ